jgi:GNAT superfamily N-acetyltransferase
MSPVSVEPVVSRKDRSDFIRFPWELYHDYPCWVPPLLMDRRKLMDVAKNPFYRHGEAEFFLARREGRIVGRIGAIVNANHDREHHERMGFFGFFESIDDQEVASALFAAARSWLKPRGAEAIRGPASPSVNDEYGLLVEGFDQPPAVLMPYNPPYYARLIEGAGLTKIKDLYAFEVTKEGAITPRLERISNIIKQREGLVFRTIDMKNFRREVDLIKALYNRAWQHNWGSVQMTDEEFEALAKDLKPVVVANLIVIAEYKGEPIGFALSLPDLNRALKHNRQGYLLPGLWCLWRYKKEIDRIRIIVLGVVPEFLRTGAGGVLFYETALRSVGSGYDYGEASWVLEDNQMMMRGAELLNGVRTKTYRIYQQPLP